MAQRLLKKIGALALLAGFACAPPAAAKENFVKYTEAKEQIASPRPAAGSATIEELRRLHETKAPFYLYDARSKADYERERIAGARLPHDEDYYKALELFRQKITRSAPNAAASLGRGLQGVPSDAVIITYCNRNCGLSKTLKTQIEDRGFTNVRYLAGGIDTWREKGYPLEGKNS